MLTGPSHRSQVVALLAAALSSGIPAGAVTISTVPIGSPGNVADTRYGSSGIGAVAYNYRIGTTEVTNAQYAEFLNAVAASDPYELYNTAMGTQTWGGIIRSGSSGSFTYAVKAPALSGSYSYDDKPVVFVSWYDAIRFANWLHNGDGNGDTETGAYTLLGGTPTPSNGHSISRNPGARWWLPSEDEWYKAAYYDPSAGVYHDYPTGTNGILNNNLPTNDTGDSANFIDSGLTTGNQDFPMTDAGAYTHSHSLYGTFDQGGNVWEWNEALFTLTHGTYRGVRGGSWNVLAGTLHASHWGVDFPAGNLNGGFVQGFRIASIPEPTTISIGTMAGASLLLLRKTCLRKVFSYISPRPRNLIEVDAVRHRTA